MTDLPQRDELPAVPGGTELRLDHLENLLRQTEERIQIVETFLAELDNRLGSLRNEP